MDIIKINDLTIHTFIGVHDWEQKLKQKLILNIAIACDATMAAKTDNVRDTIDYNKLAQEVELFAENNKYYLIETFAENLANLLLEKFSVAWIKLEVHKPGAIPLAKNVSICIERKKC